LLSYPPLVPRYVPRLSLLESDQHSIFQWVTVDRTGKCTVHKSRYSWSRKHPPCREGFAELPNLMGWRDGGKAIAVFHILRRSISCQFCSPLASQMPRTKFLQYLVQHRLDFDAIVRVCRGKSRSASSRSIDALADWRLLAFGK